MCIPSYWVGANAASYSLYFPAETSVTETDAVASSESDSSSSEVFPTWLDYIKSTNQFLDAQDISSLEGEDINLSESDVQSYSFSNSPIGISSAYRLTLDNSNLTHVDFLSSLSNVAYNLDLRRNNIVDVDGLSSFVNTGKIDLSFNQLDNVDGLSNLQSVVYLNLNSNNLHDLDGLSSLKRVDQHLNLYNNDLTDITGLSNLEKASIILPKHDLLEITAVPDLDSPFCQSILYGDVYFSSSVEIQDYMCDLPNPWYSLISENHVFTNPDDPAQSLATMTVDLSDIGLGETRIEGAKLGAETLNNFDVSGNGIQSVDFLYGLSNVTGTLDLSENDLRNVYKLRDLTHANALLLNDNPYLDSLYSLKFLREVGDLDVSRTRMKTTSGLQTLETAGSIKIENTLIQNLSDVNALSGVSGDFSIANNKWLASISGLQSLTEVGGDFDLRGNERLVNIESLSNLSSVGGQLLIDQSHVSNITSAPDLGTPFCDSITDGSIATNIDSIVSYICTPFNPWLDLIQSTGQFVDAKLIAELEGQSIDLSSQSLQQSGLTSTPIGISAYGVLNMSDNDLTSVNMMTGVESVNTLDLSNNAIEDLSGLSNLSYASTIDLRGNGELTSLSGLESLTKLDDNFYADNNPNLVDVSGLKNLSESKEGETRAYLNLPPISTLSGIFTSDDTICEHLGITRFVIVDQDWTDFCPTDDGFVEILRNNEDIQSPPRNTIDQYAYNDLNFREDDLTDETVGELKMNIERWEPTLTPPDSIFTIINEIHFKDISPELTHFDFMSNIKYIEGGLAFRDINHDMDYSGIGSLEVITSSLWFDNTQIENLSFMGSLVEAGGIYMSYNEHLVDFSGLDSLVSLGSISTRNNDSLVSLSGLESLRTIENNLSIINSSLLSDIGAIKNISYVGGDITLPDPAQLDTVFLESDPICQSIVANNNNLYFYHSNAGGNVDYSDPRFEANYSDYCK